MLSLRQRISSEKRDMYIHVTCCFLHLPLRLLRLHNHSPMPQHSRMISDDIKWAAVRMSRVLPLSVVALFLDISKESVRRVVKLAKETGDVKPPPSGATRGRPPLLDEKDIVVSYF
jgi:hypothetical protein